MPSGGSFESAASKQRFAARLQVVRAAVKKNRETNNGINEGRLWFSLFGGNSPEFYAEMLTPEEFQWWMQARKLRGKAQGDASLMKTLAGVGVGLQFVPIVGNVVGSGLLGASALIGAGVPSVAALNPVVSGAAGVPSLGGIQLSGAQAIQLGNNVGLPGGKLAFTAGKASIPGQSAAAQEGYLKEAAANIATTAAQVATPALGTGASVAIGTGAAVGNVGYGLARKK